MFRGTARKLSTAFTHTLNTREVFGGVPYYPGDRVRDFETKNFGWRILLNGDKDRQRIAKD